MNEPHRWERVCLLIGLFAGALLLLALLLSPSQFFRAYLFGFWTWWSLLPGALAILMLHDLTGGAWGDEIRDLLRPMARVLPWLALLFLPIALGLGHIYEWTASDIEVEAKRQYLSTPFFLARASTYLAIVAVLAFRATSRGRDRKTLSSALGLLLYVLVVTFASIDWLMSLEPEWISTGFGLRVVMTQSLGALALVLLLRPLARSTPSTAPASAVLVDLGNLLLAFVLLWAYLAFTEFLIIWSGNLPEEIGWYRERFQNGFEWLAVSLVLFHFGAPFLLLLMRELKKRARAVAFVASGLLVFHVLDSYWLVAPAFRTTPMPHWSHFAALLGVGAFLFAAFFREIRKERLANA
jgi:hypothetical protein